jgi:hypothetical protein
MDTKETIKVFQDSEKEIDIQRKKIQRAKMIAFRVKRMKERYPKIATSIECEIAVIQTQKMIDR